MNGGRWLRLSAKALHDIAAIAYGGGLAACLVINAMASRMSSSEFVAARQVFSAIAQYLLIPSVAVVVVSGLIAMMVTRGYQDAGWVWVKAVLGISVLVSTFRVVGSSATSVELTTATADPSALDTLLQAERGMLWLLVVLCVVNVVFAVWRPRLMIKVR